VRILVGLGVVAAAAAAVVVAGAVAHGLFSGLRPHLHLGTTQAKFGSTYTIDGRTPHLEDGPVVVEGRWDGGPWKQLSAGSAVKGAYAVRFPIRRHGRLELRVSYPGGEADGTVVVP